MNNTLGKTTRLLFTYLGLLTLAGFSMVVVTMSTKLHPIIIFRNFVSDHGRTKSFW